MIRVHRGEPPDRFEERANGWRAKLAEARRRNGNATVAGVWRSVRASVRPDAEELARRFHGKCAYCEARMEHVSHPHIEHYRPKSRTEFEHLMFDWGNWLLSCGICNEEKWTQFPESNGEPLLLNPAEEDPGPHLCFVGPHIRGVTERGLKTVQLVELDRQALRSERGLWLSLVNALLLVWVESDDTEVRRECREHLIWILQDDAPYAAMTRAYLREKCPKLANPLVPHRQLVEGDRRERIRVLVERRADDFKHLA